MNCHLVAADDEALIKSVQEYGIGRLLLHNSTTLTYEYYSSLSRSKVDYLVVHKSKERYESTY